MINSLASKLNDYDCRLFHHAKRFGIMQYVILTILKAYEILSRTWQIGKFQTPILCKKRFWLKIIFALN